MNDYNILIADDDTNDRFIIAESFKETNLFCSLDFVENGEELVDYLNKNGKYSDKPNPDIILLDLNMPRKDGRDALKEIKNNPELKETPIIILTNSKDDRDIRYCYRNGANCYLVKPLEFNDFVKLAELIMKFWFQTAIIPSTNTF